MAITNTKATTKTKKTTSSYIKDTVWNPTATKGSGLTLHDENQLDQVASIIADVLDEVRFEYRMSAIEHKVIKPGELAPAYHFRAKDLVKWIQLYYDKFRAKDTPDCFFEGTEDPKISPTFKYYYNLGVFSSPISLGKILGKRFGICRILLAGVNGNAKRWLLNPPPEMLRQALGESETDSSAGDES